EIQPVELAAPQNVGDRLAAPAPLDQLAVSAELRALEQALRIDDQPHSVAPQHGRQQELGVEPRAFATAPPKIGGGPGEHARNRPILGVHLGNDRAQRFASNSSRARRTAFSTSPRTSSRRAALGASKRSTITGPVFEARTSAQAPSPNVTRAPSIVL